MSSHSAASRTFIIPELLEQILLDVSCKDLLLFQRVSASWRATVKASHKLQTILCFEKVRREHSDSIVELNPAFSPAKTARNYSLDLFRAGYVSREDGSEFPVAVYNPFLELIFPRPYNYKHQLPTHVLTMLLDGKNSALRAMFATQPPLQKLILDSPDYGRNWSYIAANGEWIKKRSYVSGIFEVENANGVTVADIIETLISKVKIDQSETDQYDGRPFDFWIAIFRVPEGCFQDRWDEEDYWETEEDLVGRVLNNGRYLFEGRNELQECDWMYGIDEYPNHPDNVYDHKKGPSGGNEAVRNSTTELPTHRRWCAVL